MAAGAVLAAAPALLLAAAAMAQNASTATYRVDAAAMELTKKASSEFAAGDKEAACRDSLAALDLAPEFEAAFGIMKLTCPETKMPPKLKIKFKLKKFASDETPEMQGAQPTPPPEQGSPAQGGAPSPAGGAAPGSKADDIKYYEGGPKFADGVIIPEQPPPGDPRIETSARLTGEAAAKLEAGDAREAIRLATEAIETNPANPRAYLTRGVANRSKRQWRAAFDDAEMGLRLRPKDLLLLRLKADAQNGMKDYKGAYKTAADILALNPTDARAYALQAWALRGLGDLEGMTESLRKAAALDPAYQWSLDTAAAMKDDADVFFAYPGENLPEKAGKGGKGKALSGETKRILVAVGCGLIAFIGFMAGLLYWVKSKQAEAAAGASTDSAAPDGAPPAPSAEKPAPSAGASPGARRAPEPEPAAPLPSLIRPAPRAEAGSLSPGADGGERFEMRDKLGEGRAGQVFAGIDRKTGAAVAIRLVPSDISANAAEKERFLKAASSMVLPGHANIVGVHAVFEHEGMIRIAMEYVEGGALSAIMGQRKRLALVDCLAVFGFVGDALEAAHAAKVVHGDLKPSNIFDARRGNFKVSDFWFSRAIKDAVARLDARDSPALGPYAAPEQYHGRTVPASDLFSVGVCLYEALTGVVPFRGPDVKAAKEAGKPAPASSLVQDLPKALDALFDELFRPDPAQRVIGAGEFARRVKEL